MDKNLVRHLIFVVLAVAIAIGCNGQAAGKKPLVVLETTAGVIELELFPEVAPMHVANFIELVNDGFYDSLLFHRVVSGFMIQSGDPTGTGAGGSGKTIAAEFNDSLHHQGTLAAARKGNDINSASSGFYICVGKASRLAYLNKQYTVFGRTVKGLDIAVKISKVPTSGDMRRIVNDASWRKELERKKTEDGADIHFLPNGYIQADRPLQPVRIIKAYVKK